MLLSSSPFPMAITIDVHPNPAVHGRWAPRPAPAYTTQSLPAPPPLISPPAHLHDPPKPLPPLPGLALCPGQNPTALEFSVYHPTNAQLPYTSSATRVYISM